MLIVIDNETMVNVEKVQYLIIEFTPEKQKVVVGKGFLGLLRRYETKEIDCWTLKFAFIDSVSKEIKIYRKVTADKAILKKHAASIIQQIRQLDPYMINAAFEDAVLKA